MDAPTIEINGCSATLARPSTFTALALARGPEAIATMQHAEIFALQATALAVCWPPDRKWPGRLRPRVWTASAKIDEYGAAIFDDLIAGGVELAEALQAGVEAYQWAMSSLPVGKEVEQAEDFSEAPEGG